MTSNSTPPSFPASVEVQVIVDALPAPEPGFFRRALGWVMEMALLAAILLAAWGLSTLGFRGDTWFDPQLSFTQKWQRSVEQGILWDDSAHGPSYHPDERFVVSSLAPRLSWPKEQSVGQAPPPVGQPVAVKTVEGINKTDEGVCRTPRVSYFDPLYSPLNPYVAGHERDFAYGQLPLALLVWLNDQGLGLKDKSSEQIVQLIHKGLHPRQLAGYANLVTIFGLWWLVRAWRGRGTALLAALLAAFCPMLLEHARYFVVDPFMTAFVTLAAAGLVSSLRKLRWTPILLAALCSGLAVACKVTALFLLIPWAIWLVRWVVFEPRPVRRVPFTGVKPARRGLKLRLTGLVLLAVVAGFGSFRVASPYSFGGPVNWSALFAWSGTDKPVFIMPGEPEAVDLLRAQSAMPARMRELPPDEYRFLPTMKPVEYEKLYAGQNSLVRRLFAAGLWPNDLWVQAMKLRAKEQREYTGLPYFIHCFGRTPVVYSLTNLAEYSLGWGVFLFAGLGLGLSLASLRYHARQWDWAGLLLSATGLLVLLYVGTGFAQITRYYLGITPLLLALSAYGMAATTRWCQVRMGRAGQFPVDGAGPAPQFRERMRPSRWAAHLALYLIWLPRLAVGFTAFYGLAFMSIFSAPHTWGQASAWIYKNIPAKSVIAHEHWDDRLPVYLPGCVSDQYKYAEMAMYEHDNLDKRDQVIETLQKADAIVLASDRLYGAIPQRPDWYALSNNYYRQLLSGELGFHVARVFKQPPALMGLTFPDENSEHTWQIYTRPTVVVLVKDQDRTLTTEELEDKLPLQPARLLTDMEIERLIPPDPVGAKEPEIATWNGQPLRSVWSLVNSRPAGQALVWWFFLLALAWIAWPAFWPMLREWPDGGWGLMRTLSLILPALLAWWIGSVSGLGWTPVVVLTAMGLGVAAALYWGSRRTWEWQAWTRHINPAWLVAEVLIMLAFVLFTVVRVANPAAEMNFGEKAGELVALAQYLQGCPLPLVYPWFAGAVSKYYNFGWMTWSIPGMLLGFVPGVTFNLAMASLPALTIGAFFTLCARLTRSWRWGLLGALVAVVGGNWWWVWQLFHYPWAGETWFDAGFSILGIPAARLFQGAYYLVVVGQVVALYVLPAVLALLLTALAAGLGWSRRACWTTAVLAVVLGAVWAHLLLQQAPVGQAILDYLKMDPGENPSQTALWHSRLWDSTRVTRENVAPAIQEYPQFTFLWGDLHGHALGMPLLLTLLALGLLITEKRGRALGGMVTAGLVFGALVATNVWDFIVGPVGLLAIFLGGWISLYRGRPEMPFWKRALRLVRAGGLRRLVRQVAIPLGVIVLVGLAAAGPFIQNHIGNNGHEEGGVRPGSGPWADYTDFVQVFGPHLVAGVLAVLTLILLTAGRWRQIKVPAVLAVIVLIWAGCLWYVPQVVRPWLVDRIVATAQAKQDQEKAGGGPVRVLVPKDIAEGKAPRARVDGYAIGKAAEKKDYLAMLVLAMRPGATEQEVAKDQQPGGCGLILPRTPGQSRQWQSFLPSTMTLALALFLTTLAAAGFMPNRRAMIALALFSAGLGLAVLIEWAEVLERMNTIFKFGLGAWWLLVLGAVGLLAQLTRGLKLTPGKPLRWGVVVAVVAVSLAGWDLAFSTLPNHVWTLARKFNRPRPDLYTLDATRFLAVTEPDEAAVVNWLRAQHNPRLVLAEAANGYYTKHGRFATYAGTMTLLGWGWHSQRHGVEPAKVSERAGQIDALYRSADRQQRGAMLEKLHPDYVVVGEFEYEEYGPQVRSRLEATPGLREVFRSGECRVYSFSIADLYNDRLRDALAP